MMLKVVDSAYGFPPFNHQNPAVIELKTAAV